MKLKHIVLILSLIAGITAIFINPEYATALPPRVNLAPSDYTNGLSWEKAQELNKPIVANFYVDWCHYCQGFAPTLYKLRQQYESKYSFVYINCEDPKNKLLVKKFNIRAYPSLFLVDKKKNRKVQIDNSKMTDINLLSKELDKFLK